MPPLHPAPDRPTADPGDHSRPQPQRPQRAVRAAALAGPADGGVRRAATVPDGRDRIPVDCPADGRRLGDIPRAAPDDVASAVRRARTAQRSWARVPVRQRAQAVRRLGRLVLDVPGAVGAVRDFQNAPWGLYS